MDNLPSELLHDIFIYLPVIQQLQCMLVSRLWARIIHGRSLYHTVYVKDEYMFQELLKRIKQKPDLANNVECLSLCRVGASNMTEREILELFPNIKTLNYSWFDNPHDTTNDSGEENQRLLLKNRPKILSDNSNCILIKLMLAEGLCTHLVSLDLSFSRSGEYTTNDMLPFLKDMPVLKYLELCNTPIKITDFEILHSNIPSLQSLKLSEMRLLLSDFPTRIKPATLFTTLEVYGEFVDPQTKYDWFKYIIEKYPSLTVLLYSIMDYVPDEFDKKSLIIRADFEDVLRKLGPQLQTLNYYGDLNMFSKKIGRDDCKWNLKKVIFRECLHQSGLAALVRLHQFKFIENLLICLSAVPFPLNNLENMKHLKILGLHFYQTDHNSSDDNTDSALEYREFITLNLDEVFQYLHSSVESVDITCYYATFYDTEIQYTNIKTLILDIPKLQKRVDDFVVKRLPNLHSLTLTDCYELGGTLEFPNHQFSYLRFFSYRQNSIRVSIITDNFNTEHYYTTDGSYFHEYAEFNSFLLIASSERRDDSKVVFVKCCSVKRLVLGSVNRRDADALLIPF
ncbi:hypothetical protein K501DRAFT_302986 [Backusella circina FSU 941]|nr:hypothetical protein K501DRAFT_302986 [Backusella circina FSU 941]